ncbi:MAG TPA: DUF2630 family protein [Micromonosporaceae bacterium]|nr:DUF2630 family protein [Micromonosporaceae bacterium]
MDDRDVLGRISELVDEEHRLRERRLAGELSTDDEQVRLRDVEEALDQCWDLLRRRRAAREQGGDPDAEQVRDRSTVETYLQ